MTGVVVLPGRNQKAQKKSASRTSDHGIANPRRSKACAGAFKRHHRLEKTAKLTSSEGKRGRKRDSRTQKRMRRRSPKDRLRTKIALRGRDHTKKKSNQKQQMAR